MIHPPKQLPRRLVSGLGYRFQGLDKRRGLYRAQGSGCSKGLIGDVGGAGPVDEAQGLVGEREREREREKGRGRRMWIYVFLYIFIYIYIYIFVYMYIYIYAGPVRGASRDESRLHYLRFLVRPRVALTSMGTSPMYPPPRTLQ